MHREEKNTMTSGDMTRSFLTLSLSLLYVVNAKPTLCRTANTIDIMQTCYTTFINSYGLPGNPFPLVDFFSGFHAKRTEMLDEYGKEAEPTIKEYGVALTNCLANIENCIEDGTYETPKLGAQPGDGHRYNTDRVITAYQTSERGYDIHMRHFDCLRECADSTAAVTEKCDDDLAAIQKPTCKDYSDNMQCYKNAYSGCCGPEGGEFQCNTVGAEYTIFMKEELANGSCKFDDCA